ncbi:MAG: DUF4345 domain-containing protein [Myxococcota bacterium]|jgi:hypothetical protein|nr:DUF4345 domain-containing protein [Myxococcota bacterium]
MDPDRFATYALGILAVSFAAVALQGLLVPGFLLAPVELGLETASAHAEIRAGYGGCFGGLAAAFWAGARTRAWRRPGLGLAAVVLGLFVSGRLVSLGVEGAPNPFSWAVWGLEALGFGICAWLWRRLGSPDRDGSEMSA